MVYACLRDVQVADADVRDDDVFYFDDSDLSWARKTLQSVACRRATADLGVTVEIRNQARWARLKVIAPDAPPA